MDAIIKQVIQEEINRHSNMQAQRSVSETSTSQLQSNNTNSHPNQATSRPARTATRLSNLLGRIWNGSKGKPNKELKYCLTQNACILSHHSFVVVCCPNREKIGTCSGLAVLLEMFVFIIRIRISHTSTVPLLVNNTGYNNIAYGKPFNLTQTGFKITCQVVVADNRNEYFTFVIC